MDSTRLPGVEAAKATAETESSRNISKYILLIKDLKLNL
jgi:hypothetical protein